MTIIKHCVERLLNSSNEESSYDYQPIFDALNKICGKGSYKKLYQGMIEAHLRNLENIDLSQNLDSFAVEKLNLGHSKLDVSRALACANLSYILNKRSPQEERRAINSIPDLKRSTYYGLESLF
jgi:hypothetical protein